MEVEGSDEDGPSWSSCCGFGGSGNASVDGVTAVNGEAFSGDESGGVGGEIGTAAMSSGTPIRPRGKSAR
jgi:hypothetical protein